MTTEQFKELHKSRPFLPFHLHMASGRVVTVRHPEFAMLTPGGRTAVVATSNDAAEVVDLLLVESISVGNGKHGSKKRSNGT